MTNDITPLRQDQGPEPRRLARSNDDKMLMCVCGGLGKYFDVDPVLIRVLFAIGAIALGSTALVYIVLTIVMPSEDMLEAHPRDAARGTVDEVSDNVKSAISWVQERLPFGNKN